MMIRGVLLGIAGTALILFAVSYLAVVRGVIPANADARPGRLERWAARNSLSATVAREATTGDNPVALTDQNVTAGIRLYSQNCSVCHGGSAGRSSNIARGLYQHPPRFSRRGVEEDPPGEVYWKISHGIRFTGMPAFRQSLREKQIWQIALFLKHMDALAPVPKAQWMKVR